PAQTGFFQKMTKAECHYLNGRKQVKFLVKDIYNREQMSHFDSDVGHFVADTLLGEPDAKYWNSQPDILERHRAEVDRLCRHNYEVVTPFTVERRAPPQIRIVSVPLPNTPDAVLLTCHVWGFYPAEVMVLWLHNGDVVATGDNAELLPNGDWTYQTQVTLTVTAKVGDTFTCSVQHASLDRPLCEDWGPGLSPGLTVKVVAAAVVMTVGLVVFTAGTFSYCRQAPGEGQAWGTHVWHVGDMA
ncbi:HB2L protein, partial [Haliaeetus albicilla]|nr:HB2L protein [Haliaeetus albicilla]